MKFTIYFVLFFLLGCNSSSELKEFENSNIIDVKSKKDEGFANSILTCFKNKDYNSFSNLLISKEEGIRLLSISNLSKEEMEEYKSDFEKNHKVLIAKSHADFNKVILDGENDGLVWGNIKYNSCNFNIRNIHSTESARLSIEFDHKGSFYEIILDEVLKSENEWRTLGNISYNNHLNEKRFQGSSKEVADSLAKYLEDATSK